jgi:hypothetical protein
MQRVLDVAARRRRESEALGDTGATDAELDGDWQVRVIH